MSILGKTGHSSWGLSITWRNRVGGATCYTQNFVSMLIFNFGSPISKIKVRLGFGEGHNLQNQYGISTYDFIHIDINPFLGLKAKPNL